MRHRKEKKLDFFPGIAHACLDNRWGRLDGKVLKVYRSFSRGTIVNLEMYT